MKREGLLPFFYLRFLFPSLSHSFFLPSHASLSKIAFCHDKSTTKIKQIWLFPFYSSLCGCCLNLECYIWKNGEHCVRVIFMWTIFITECEVDHKLQKWRPIKEVIESHMWKKDQGVALLIRKMRLRLNGNWILLKEIPFRTSRNDFWVEIYWWKRDIEMEMMISQFLLS